MILATALGEWLALLWWWLGRAATVAGLLALVVWYDGFRRRGPGTYRRPPPWRGDDRE